jgi:hypothetical protein
LSKTGAVGSGFSASAFSGLFMTLPFMVARPGPYLRQPDASVLMLVNSRGTHKRLPRRHRRTFFIQVLL